MGRPSNTEERRGQIVDALTKVMAGEGYASATIAAIAKQAKLAPGLIHYHFADKHEILVALVVRLVDRLERRVEARLSEAGETARERLHAVVDAHVALGDDADPAAVGAWVIVATEAIRQDDVRALYAPAIAKTLRRLEALVRASLDDEKKDRKNAKRIAAAILAAIEGSYLLSVSAPGVLPAGYAAPSIRALVDAILDA